MLQNPQSYDTATLGGGCFWCTEAIFTGIKGVISVEPGYSGGFLKDPLYEEVCTGKTGHAEVIQIVFDPQIVSYEYLLDVFWHTHDPTTLNRQGADVGTQYRSVIFYHSGSQKKIASEMKEKLNVSEYKYEKVVTEISPFVNFYKAEDYHQNYFRNHPNQPYCKYTILPKVQKFNKIYGSGSPE